VRVHVGDLLADPHAVRVLTVSLRLPPPTEDVILPEPVEGQFVLCGTGRSVLVTGGIRTNAELICGACLATFRYVLDISVDEEFRRTQGHGATEGREELEPEDFVVPIEPGDELDLGEVVRQHLIMALPIAPRCRPDCRGLCPRCGADRNTGACRCDGSEIDPRFLPLRQWSAAKRERRKGT
jgi:uncharacterized protein